MVKAKQSRFEVDGVVETGLGLIFNRKINRDEFQHVGDIFNRETAIHQWEIGDWLAFGEREFRDIKPMFENWPELNYETCRSWERVSFRFNTHDRRLPADRERNEPGEPNEPAGRVDGLSWSHHHEAAAHPPEEADALLAWCLEPVLQGSSKPPVSYVQRLSAGKLRHR